MKLNNLYSFCFQKVLNYYNELDYFFIFYVSKFENNYMSKYKIIYMVLSSKFVTVNHKEKFLKYIVLTSRIYWLFKNLYLKFKYSKFTIYNISHSLEYKNLESLKHIIILNHNQVLYKFNIYDIIKIIKTALHTHQGLFINSIYPKNPYTNVTFSFENLFNIYMYCLNNHISIPIYLHLFYKAHFNINKFIEINESYLTIKLYNNYYNDKDDDIIYNDIIIFLRYLIRIKNIARFFIHPLYPKDEIIYIFTPMLSNMLLLICYPDSLVKTMALIKLKNYIRNYLNNNKYFGRMYIKIKSSSRCRYDKKYIISVDMARKFKIINLLDETIPIYGSLHDIINYISH